MTASLVLVTGATGAIGPALVTTLIERGYRVRALCRTAPPDGLLPDGAEIARGDLLDAVSVEQAMANVDYVLHLAALLHIDNPPPSLRAEYTRVNVDGTRSLAQAAQRARVKRLIYFSTVKVYGAHNREPVTETHPTNPENWYATTKLEGEQAALDSIEATVLRLSPVYGPRLRGSWQRLVGAIQKGWFLPIGDLTNRRSLTYVDDVANAAVLCLERDEAAGRIYNLVGHEALTMRMILDGIYAACERQRPAISIPATLARLGARGLQAGFSLVGRRSPLTLEQIALLTESETYSGAQLRALGFEPQVALDEGWRRVIAAAR
ncbi:MAG: NAD-dependent epimerase/dehydratase family protein [Anaerolineae bacterium]|nr:NAD-dependent epimerase/dehydratase family protein [Anaerolineae bacterium]